MRYYRFHFKFISFLLTISILFQGCQIYYKQTATPEQAFESSKKVKIVYTGDRKEYFNKIVIEDGILYGIKKFKGKSYKISLHKNEIKEIHLKNKTASVLVTVLVFTVVPFGSILLIGIISFSQGNWL
jgi:hypothetical protein